MLLESGGSVTFQTRPIEGLESTPAKDAHPERLILDGQQRLTTLTQALAIVTPVHTRTSTGKKIKRHYYFDIQAALDSPQDLASAVVAVDENRQKRSNFGRDVDLDLSTCDKECLALHFPCDQTMNSDKWEEALHRVAPEHFPLYMTFRSQVLKSFREYLIPVIQLHKDTSKEAVCLVFEKVNTGGVALSVFELVTASYAAEGYNLRDDWYGSTVRNVKSRRERLAREPLLAEIEATEFLQALTLLFTHERKRSDIAQGRTGKDVRPVSAKRADVLELPLSAWRDSAESVEKGFNLAAKFLHKESIYSRRELPYSTQLVPLAAVMARIGDKWLEPRIYDKIARWYWCGVMGELYGGAVETRIANDYEQLLDWFGADDPIPRTVFDAGFQADRFDTLRSRLSAAYKGINILILREGARDWFWKAGIQDLDIDEIALDIHHIFPRAWCIQNKIPRNVYDSILNKTTLSYKANRKISGDAPSAYLPRIQAEPNVQLTDSQMDALIASHAIDGVLLRTDSFEAFIADRRQRLADLISAAMGKPVSLSGAASLYEESPSQGQEPDDTPAA